MRLILGRDHRHLVRHMPLGHALPFVHQDRIRILHPHFHRQFNRVVAPPHKLIHLLLWQRLLASVGHLYPFACDVELHHVAMLREFHTVMIGPLVEVEEQRRT